MIKRAFAEGWGFCVTKTLCPDEMLVTNVSPRIVRASTTSHHGPNQAGFMNIELLTEKSEKYWEDGIRELKQAYPDRIVICSIMAPHEQAPWVVCCRGRTMCGRSSVLSLLFYEFVSLLLPSLSVTFPQRLAKRMEAAGSDMLELNLSCPHTGRKGTGMLAGQSVCFPPPSPSPPT